MTETTNPTTSSLATQQGLLPLRSLQLIGVAGPQEARRALLRTSAGKVRSVSVGDQLRQGTVVAIAEDAMILATASGQRTLRMPTLPDGRAAA